MEQLDFAPAPIWDTSIAGGGFMRYTTVLALDIHACDLPSEQSVKVWARSVYHQVLQVMIRPSSLRAPLAFPVVTAVNLVQFKGRIQSGGIVEVGGIWLNHLV